MHRASINHRPEKCHDRKFSDRLHRLFRRHRHDRNRPLFLAVTAAQDKRAKIRITIEATLVATLIMVFFALCGSWVLHYLKIGEPAFKITGGVILFLVAWDMLNSKRQARKRRETTAPALASAFAPDLGLNIADNAGDEAIPSQKSSKGQQQR